MWRFRSGKNRDWPGEPPRARAPLLRRPALPGSWRWSAAPLAPQARRMEERTRRFGLAGRARLHAAANHAYCKPREHIGERPRDALPQDTHNRVFGKTCGRRAWKKRVVPVGFERENEIKANRNAGHDKKTEFEPGSRVDAKRRGRPFAVKLASCAALLAVPPPRRHLFKPLRPGGCRRPPHRRSRQPSQPQGGLLQTHHLHLGRGRAPVRHGLRPVPCRSVRI